MEGGRKLEHMARYSACIVIDIDDSPIPVLELLRRAAEFPYVKAGHVSPSGTGVKLFIMVDSDLKIITWPLKSSNTVSKRGSSGREGGHQWKRSEPWLFLPAMIRTLFIRKNLKRSKSPLLTRSLRPLPDIPPEACAPARGFRTTLTSMNKAILCCR
ncbi:MAG: BT4734/BF3469 family protein [Parabacteroides merdae]